MTLPISRRNISLLAGATATASLIPGRVLGANGKINVACVGIGGRGEGVLRSINQTGIANIVALCDVALGSKHTAKMEAMFSQAQKIY